MTREDAAAAWAASGAMALTGRPDGPPLLAPTAVVDRIGALGAGLPVDPLVLLGERAAIAGLERGGAVSCGGSTRLVATSRSWVAVTLAREDDIAAIPAWLELEHPTGADPWTSVTSALAAKSTDEVVERAQLLGLPVAELRSVAWPERPVRELRIGDAPPLTRPLLVVDLSSLWAGPLCAHLLGLGGARVVKVESTTRPDGARRGPAAFYDLLHAGHESVVLDFGAREDVAALRELVAGADVVIEASRTRALEQLGIDATRADGARTRVWVSITGYGRSADRVAFGDDAAVAGGLVAEDADGPCFVADAVADPLTGIAAAAAARGLLERGGRWLLDVAMAEVAAYVAGAGGSWGAAPELAVRPPRARAPAGRAAALGAHTDAVLAGLTAR